ncbi:cupin domain-containing protein [Neomegalonema sp.]|uniref:cupin domain-containing protein n=1 Tax=Neomegalonema sp. TaxID=2039713 RepID=UPI00260831B7|nr:cupin domain-containing protein [Neomegalonema sp.]MDD2869731.1 cupin domain-containing protein [Neomegalonema sp.]
MPSSSAPASGRDAADRTRDGAAPARDAALGEKLRLRRKRKRLSLKAVAERSGLSIGLLSLVERGLTTPSVRSMRAICAALEMPVLWLFEGGRGEAAREGDVVVRQADRRRLNYAENGVEKEILTPDAQADVQMLRFVMRAGADSGEPYGDGIGGKCGVVLRGSLRLTLDEREFILGPGDSFAFDARRKVRFRTEGDEECEVIWVVAPPTV